VFKAEKGKPFEINVTASFDSRDPVSSFEVVQNGRVVRAVPFEEWKQTGLLGTIRFEESGWFLVRTIANVPGTFRFASTAPFYVEMKPAPHRISKASAQFFLDWVRERSAQIKLDDSRQQEEVIRHHRMAERFWEAKVAESNAE
jgi:hypothetical protein